MYPAIGAARCSSRWCPTAEQVMLLEELYKGGLTNPSAGQIHQIVAHLSQFGNIQGKNVFYWFQNHKARDKQKYRKKQVRQYQLVGLEKMQCSKSPNCFNDNHCCSSSLSFFNNDEILKRIPATVLSGEISKPNTNARCCGGILRMQDSVIWSCGLKPPLPKPKQPPSCDVSRFPPLVTLDLFPVTPRIKEVEYRNNLSRNYPSTSIAPQLLPNPNLTLGAPGLTNY